MPFEDFKGFWKVTISEEGECPIDSIVTFDRPDDKGPVTILCVKDPSFFYGEGTGSYTDNTIEVSLKDGEYVISMGGTDEKPTITFAKKEPGPAAGSWTAEDYVPGSEPEPASE